MNSGNQRNSCHLSPSQWLPKPATSQFPEKGRALRATWSPRGGEGDGIASKALARVGGKWCLETKRATSPLPAPPQAAEREKKRHALGLIVLMVCLFASTVFA